MFGQVINYPNIICVMPSFVMLLPCAVLCASPA